MDVENSLVNMETSIGKMSVISEGIHEIADKVNLVSLNASIEAAKAGDYSLGFAVVSKEIARLAEQTSEILKESDDMIKNIKNYMKGTKQKMELSSNKFHDILIGVNKIQSITDDIDKDTNHLLKTALETEMITKKLKKVISSLVAQES